MILINNTGLSKDKYNQVKSAVAKQNMKTLQWVSLLTAILMFLLIAATLTPLFSSIAMNRMAYIITGVISGLIYVTTLLLLPKHAPFVKPLFYFFLFVVIVFSVHIGVITNVAQRASTICVLLLAIPLLITDKSWRISLFLTLSAILFCVTSYFMKEPTLFLSDFVNCFCIYVISIAVNIAQQNIKYRSFYDRYIIEQNHIRLIHKQEQELEESRISIMLSQIQPHFLYNSLTAIAQLCDKEPIKAKETTLNFSEYLRQNMNSLDQREPIPFETELQHVRNYLAIEHVRFGEDLHVVYDIKAVNFLLPPLTLQPIVENAVKHGVGMKEDGGTVIVSSKEAADYYEVVVFDGGVGFDVSAISMDGRTHTGIENVRSRLAVMVGGTLEIHSTPDVGTTVTMRIPKKRQ